jgi:hypothetical protein
MNMKIDFSKLKLHFYESSFTGAGSQQTLKGVLLKAGERIACLQPWPGLGDPTLEELLSELKESLKKRTPEEDTTEGLRNEWHPLLRHSLRALETESFCPRKLLDLEKSGASIPTHVLINRDTTREELVELLNSGVQKFKIKLRKEYDFSCGVFKSMRELSSDFDFQIRFDANSTYSFEDFSKEWERIGELRGLVEFVEDPCPFDFKQWESLASSGVPLANDRPLHFMNPDEVLTSDPSQFLVMKPIRHDLEEWRKVFLESGKKTVLTTALDHPWGQLWAFYRYVQLRNEGVPLSEGGFSTATLKNSYHNPLLRQGREIVLSGVQKLIDESETYKWVDL